MPKKSPEQRSTARFIPVLLALIAATATADDYREARADLVAAYQAEDYKAMRAAAERSLEARPGYPGALFNLALAQVLDGNEYAAMKTLNTLLEKKIDFGVKGMDEFEPLRRMPDWAPYSEAVAKLHEPVGEAEVAFSHEVGDFIPEGIALDAKGGVYLGSIRHGDIIYIGETTQTLVTAEQGGHWSVFGMRYDGDRTLWYVSAAMDEFTGREHDDTGTSGLFAVDAHTGEVKVRTLLPESENKQVLGDLLLVDADTIFLADQADGIVYRYTISSGEFSVVVDRGAISSPQGIVLDDSGEYLYVADYIGGLYRAHVDSGAVGKVAALDTASDYGIDGLYRHGNRLIAIQNGIQPNRVVEFELSEDGTAVVASRILAMNLPEFDDPNLGEIDGDDFVFIANSHWPRFDREFNLPEDLEGPVVMRITLDD